MRRPAVPRGTRVYAIGDIHGRVDLLVEIEALIRADIAASPCPLACYVVYLGDYVDRGFSSRQVLTQLVEQPLEGCQRVCLIGNHDLWLHAFLEGHAVGNTWLQHGGDATLLSYGVQLDLHRPETERLAAAHDRLLERMPASHYQFLNQLEVAFSFGDYFFCHAGVRPGVPLAAQAEADLLWIREPFLNFDGDLGKVVVHGHTVEMRPVVRRHRIGIDTGACWTSRLTCLVLEGTERRFLMTGSAPPPSSS